jgi:hypothetical protein
MVLNPFQDLSVSIYGVEAGWQWADVNRQTGDTADIAQRIDILGC